MPAVPLYNFDDSNAMIDFSVGYLAQFWIKY